MAADPVPGRLPVPGFGLPVPAIPVPVKDGRHDVIPVPVIQDGGGSGSVFFKPTT